MAHLISRSAFSRRAGVSPAAITKACRNELKPACHADRIDDEHEAAVAYLARHPGAQTAKQKRGKKNSRDTPAGGRFQLDAADSDDADGPRKDVDPDDIETYADLTLRQLVERFGTERAFRDWLDALKKIEDIREKRLSNDESEGLLILRSLVKTHVFGAIDAANRRLLGDTPKTIARRLYAAAKSGAPIEEAERIVRELIGSQLKPVKATASRVLRSA